MLRLLPGQVIDGFTLVEPLHRGGMALLWRVTHSAHRQPLLMKVPLIAYGEGPGAIVGFEVEQMILPRLSGRTCRASSPPPISRANPTS